MKIGGIEASRCEEVLVLPRANGPDIVFKAQAVLSMEDFDAMVPRPTVPTKVTKDGKQENPESKNYLSAIDAWSKQRHAYICVKSLEPSNIEWDTVKADSPGTWKNWIDDLEKAGFSSVEIQRIQQCVLDANCLNEGKLRVAREAFLRGQGNKE